LNEEGDEISEIEELNRINECAIEEEELEKE
jgi:hypothetical protein